jgi:hypothetical protein
MIAEPGQGEVPFAEPTQFWVNMFVDMFAEMQEMTLQNLAQARFWRRTLIFNRTLINKFQVTNKSTRSALGLAEGFYQ